MIQKDFLERLQDNYNKCVEISRQKGSDYSGEEDVFKNFEIIDKLTGGVVSGQVGLLVRLSDKMTRVSTLLTSGKDQQVADEAVTDTLRDMANYAMILKIYLEEKYDKQKN